MRARRSNGAWAAARLRPTVVALGLALGAAFCSSLLAASGGLGGAAVASAVVLAAWGALALVLATALLPGFGLGGIVRRAPAGGDDHPTIALTFDDGPHPETTPALLEALAAARAPATFFLVGEQVRRHPELARAIAAAGHSVGNHTQRHRLLAFRSLAEIDAEVGECQATLAACGLAARLFRPPHGFKPPGLPALLARHGLRLVAWQGTLRDTDGPAPEELSRRALAAGAPGRILLLHDSPTTRGATVAALPAIIAGYRERGYRFVPLP